jgi:hypothetical protein
MSCTGSAYPQQFPADGKSLAGLGGEFVFAADVILEWRERPRPEWLFVCVVFKELHHGFIPIEVRERTKRKRLAELLLNRLGICISQAESDE